MATPKQWLHLNGKAAPQHKLHLNNGRVIRSSLVKSLITSGQHKSYQASSNTQLITSSHLKLSSQALATSCRHKSQHKPQNKSQAHTPQHLNARQKNWLHPNKIARPQQKRCRTPRSRWPRTERKGAEMSHTTIEEAPNGEERRGEFAHHDRGGPERREKEMSHTTIEVAPNG